MPIRVSLSPGQMRPVACLVHVEVVPRRAVRKVGPRLGLIAAPALVNLVALAGLLGDGSRSS